MPDWVVAVSVGVGGVFWLLHFVLRKIPSLSKDAIASIKALRAVQAEFRRSRLPGTSNEEPSAVFLAEGINEQKQAN
ncbi:hypothetical protein [Kitasatospora sp. MBT66]|uniref:hypothetical protein n=1 Tax=Kitasatospora sp. MBT66 TaxID=1444769 RepID=UPI0005B883AD|nr:hypothetical protein [Kitasatospora sp. MBT66]